MKKVFLLLILFGLISCRKDIAFYDIDGAYLNFFTIFDNYVLFQFNEPIRKLKVIFSEKDSLVITNSFPKANIKISTNYFKEHKEYLKFETLDTSNNRSSFTMEYPVINTNPALIELFELQFKYSKKSEQNIVLKTLTNGSINGYKFVVFQRGQKYIIPIKDENVKIGERVTLFIDKTTENIKNSEIVFSKRVFKLFFKNRLSQSNGLVYIIDNNNKIIDYILYYDSKSNDIEKIKNQKSFKTYLEDLNNNGIKPIITDIKGNSIKNKVRKIGKNFVTKEK